MAKIGWLLEEVSQSLKESLHGLQRCHRETKQPGSILFQDLRQVNQKRCGPAGGNGLLFSNGQMSGVEDDVPCIYQLSGGKKEKPGRFGRALRVRFVYRAVLLTSELLTVYYFAGTSEEEVSDEA